MRVSVFLFILVSLLFSACRKDEKLPADEIGDPVFYLDATLDQNALSFYAGDDNYIMDPSYSQENDNLYVFRGDLRQKNCATPCSGYSLTVLINDYRLSNPGAAMNVDSAIKIGPYQLSDRSQWPTSQHIYFVPFAPLSTNNNYTWTVANDQGIVLKAGSYSLNGDFEIGKTYSVSYAFEDVTGGCQAFHQNVFRVGNPFQSTITVHNEAAASSFKFIGTPDADGEYTYAWDFGDGNTGSGKEVYHSFMSSTTNTFVIKLTTTNSKNQTSVSYYQLSILPSAQCDPNFAIKIMPVDMSKILKTATILLKKSDGKTYSSAETRQAPGGFFIVRSVLDYPKENGKGEPTKMLEITFDCLLKSSAEVAHLSSQKSLIAVSYKKK